MRYFIKGQVNSVHRPCTVYNSLVISKQKTFTAKYKLTEHCYSWIYTVLNSHQVCTDVVSNSDSSPRDNVGQGQEKFPLTSALNKIRLEVRCVMTFWDPLSDECHEVTNNYHKSCLILINKRQNINKNTNTVGKKKFIFLLKSSTMLKILNYSLE